MEPAQKYEFTFEQKKHVNAEEQGILIKAFKHYDADKSGTIPEKEFAQVMIDMGNKMSQEAIDEIFAKYDRNQDGVINWEEFKTMMIGMKESKDDRFGTILKGGKAQLADDDLHAIHTYSVEERHTFASVINVLIQDDEALKDRLPMNAEDESLFHVFDNGVLVNKLMLKLDENCVDERAINVKSNMNIYEVN